MINKLERKQSKADKNSVVVMCRLHQILQILVTCTPAFDVLVLVVMESIDVECFALSVSSLRL